MSARHRLLRVIGLLAVVVTSALAYTASASAEAWVLHANIREPFTGTFYNLCDLADGPDSPTFTGSGSYQQQATVALMSDLHVAVSIHFVTQVTGRYPDGRRVVFNSTFNANATANIDPISFETGEATLASALTATSTQHEILNVQGKDGTPDVNVGALVHYTFAPDFRLTSMRVEYRYGC